MAKLRAKHPAVEYKDVTLQGDTYHLCFSYNSIALAEEQAGVNMLRTFSFSNLDARQYRAMLWACLLPAHPDMTLEQAGDLITIDKMPEITAALVAAWSASLPANPQQPASGK